MSTELENILNEPTDDITSFGADDILDEITAHNGYDDYDDYDMNAYIGQRPNRIVVYKDIAREINRLFHIEGVSNLPSYNSVLRVIFQGNRNKNKCVPTWDGINLHEGSNGFLNLHGLSTLLGYNNILYFNDRQSLFEINTEKDYYQAVREGKFTKTPYSFKRTLLPLNYKGNNCILISSNFKPYAEINTNLTINCRSINEQNISFTYTQDFVYYNNNKNSYNTFINDIKNLYIYPNNVSSSIRLEVILKQYYNGGFLPTYGELSYGKDRLIQIISPFIEEPFLNFTFDITGNIEDICNYPLSFYINYAETD